MVCITAGQSYLSVKEVLYRTFLICYTDKRGPGPVVYAVKTLPLTSSEAGAKSRRIHTKESIPWDGFFSLRPCHNQKFDKSEIICYHFTIKEATMAIGKEETNKLTEEQLAKVEALEKEIDEAIREGYGYDDKRIIVSIPYPPKKVRQELARRYRKAGWRIAFHLDDGRGDGDWVSLT